MSQYFPDRYLTKPERVALVEAKEKRCGMCKVVQPFSNFSFACDAPQGLRHNCKDCVRILNAQSRSHYKAINAGRL